MIHQYKSNGYNIVMDVNSGSIHVVDDIVYEMIPLIEPLVNEGIKDADTIATLAEKGGGSVIANPTQANPMGVRMATTMVATVPILVTYPFFQKYFISGITVGAVKG